MGRGTEGIGGGGVASGVDSAGVGNATGTAGRAGTLTAGSGDTVAGESNSGASVRSPTRGGLATGEISPPTMSAEALAGLTVGARSPPFAGDAVGTGAPR